MKGDTYKVQELCKCVCAYITMMPRENLVSHKHKKGYVVLYICITIPSENMRQKKKRARHEVRS